MPEEKPADAVEKFLQEEKAVEDRKQALIDDLLRQRAEAIKVFDDKLAKLGHKSRDGKPRRSHHKQAQPPPEDPAKPEAKPAAKPKG